MVTWLFLSSPIIISKFFEITYNKILSGNCIALIPDISVYDGWLLSISWAKVLQLLCLRSRHQKYEIYLRDLFCPQPLPSKSMYYFFMCVDAN